MPRVNTLNTQREQTTIRLPKELKNQIQQQADKHNFLFSYFRVV